MQNKRGGPLSRNPSLAGIFLGAITRSKSTKAVPVQKTVPTPSGTQEVQQPPSKKQRKQKKMDKGVDTQPTEYTESEIQILAQVAQEYISDPWYSDKANTASLTMQADGLYRNSQVQVMIPDNSKIKNTIITELHATPYGGHGGITKTYENVSRLFFWPSMRKDVIQYVHYCAECQRNKPSNQKPASLLQQLQIPEKPWDSVSMDFITQLPVTPVGYDAITVFVCRLTKMAHFVPCYTTITALELAFLFLREVVHLRQGLQIYESLLEGSM